MGKYIHATIGYRNSGQIIEQDFPDEDAMYAAETLDTVILHCETRYTPDHPMWVNVYYVQRRYGGAEEGGWWYDIYDCLECVRLPYAEAVVFADRKALEYRTDENKKNPFLYYQRHWQYEVLVEEERAASQTPPHCRPTWDDFPEEIMGEDESDLAEQEAFR